MPVNSTTKDFLSARVDELNTLQDQDQSTLDSLEVQVVNVTDRMTDRAALIAILETDLSSM